MSRDKQFDEHLDLTDTIHMSGYGLLWEDCTDIAHQIQDQGYRKASDVAEEIFAEIEKKISLDLDVISKEKDELIYKGFFSHALLCEFNYKINTLRGIAKFIAELKKKYTEGKDV